MFILRTIYEVNGTARYFPRQENTLLGNLFLPRDMSDSYKAFLYDDEPSPKHVATTPLSLSLPNPSFDKSIQDFVTDSSILIS